MSLAQPLAYKRRWPSAKDSLPQPRAHRPSSGAHDDVTASQVFPAAAPVSSGALRHAGQSLSAAPELTDELDTLLQLVQVELVTAVALRDTLPLASVWIVAVALA